MKFSRHDKFRHYALIWAVVVLCVFSSAACVGSKPKGGGRIEPETKLPPRNGRPQLRKQQGGFIEPFEAHGYDWSALEPRVNLVRSPLNKKFKVEGFGPFIVATNVAKDNLYRLKENTIRASYNAFYKDYFTELPREIITIYLFKNRQDYLYYSRKLFNESPSTPYGFYRSDERVMLMDISTGTGTLVHEMAHALLDADFPEAPTWFNEGFSSLYEQSRISAGSLEGVSNWRYPILRRAIETDSLVKLRQLLVSNDEQFYDDQEGYHYAEARYLCYYLQELGLLKTFYRNFKKNHATDPSGIKTLEELLKKDIDEIEKDWLQWALKLPAITNRA